MKRTMLPLALLGAALAVAPLAGGAPKSTAATAHDGPVAIKAGTIHLVEDGRVIEGGGTILVSGNRIQAVGADVEIPADAHVIDYGKHAVVIPGLVAAHSSYALGTPSKRTAEPGVRAIDGFDFFGKYASGLAGGVTSVYVTPAEQRLISGEGALVKLGGDDIERRTLNASATIHGAIDSTARGVQGYWEPPIPATVDQGMGFHEPQLPRTTMGAILGLEEMIEVAQSGDTGTIYGPYAGGDLARLMAAKTPWRISASNDRELRALLGFAGESGVPLIIDKANAAKDLAAEIASVGAAVVYRVPYSPNTSGRALGKSRDSVWPTYDVPAALVEAGVRVAITGSNPRDLLFHASLASRGGLDPAAALRAITLTPAEMFGAADRVGSIRAGKDADFVVLSGPPISGGLNVIATWIDGHVVWNRADSGSDARKESDGGASAKRPSATVVIDVEELHVGDGEVLRPGQLLIKDGKIVEVGTEVARPAGAVVHSARAAMPGMIDALGHLGLDNSRRVPATDFQMSSIVAPGDHVDRRVAAQGITTVVLSPRGSSATGAPVMAYKPAGEELERQVIGDPVALRVTWQSRNRLKSGAAVKGLLAKAKAYRDAWLKYEREIAAWTPPPPEPEKKEEEAEEDEEDEEEKKDDDDKKKKKKKKKKGEEELEPDPITGRWEAEVGDPAVALKLRLKLEGGKGSGSVEGNLRCSALSDSLVELSGYWNREERSLEVAGLGSSGWVSLEAKLEMEEEEEEKKEEKDKEDKEDKKDKKEEKEEVLKLVGKVTSDGTSFDVSAERTSKEYPVAKRTEVRPVKPEKPKKIKGEPKKPKFDAKLEPLKAAMEGRAAIICQVERQDEILACVATFEEYGIKPVLLGARDAYKVAGEITDRVAGVLLSPIVLQYEAQRGTDYRTPHVELQNAGIPVAFHSGQEEGAVDLPLAAAFAVANGMSPSGALRALTSDTATMMVIAHRVGRLARGLDGDVLLLDGPPLAASTSVLRAFVNGVEVHP